MDTTSFLAQYLPPPVVGFLIGLTAGVTIGVLFSGQFFSYLSEGRRLRRADREAERQRRAKAAQQRLAIFRKRHEAEARRAFIAARIERGVRTNIDGCVVDADGRLYCASCFDRDRLVTMRETQRGFICPECGEEI